MSAPEITDDSTATPASILTFAKDLPNLCSLTGLLFAVLAIFFAMVGNFPAAMIGLIWAIFFDWSDGIIARGMTGRSKKQQEFGAQLDSLIDIISFGICPAVTLLSYGNFSLWFVPGAFIMLAAGVLRLSYFNVFGLVGSSYRGLALDYNAMVLVFLFVFEGLVSQPVFATLLYIVLVAMAALNVSPIRTPKLGGAWYYGIFACAVLLTFIYGWQLLQVEG